MFLELVCFEFFHTRVINVSFTETVAWAQWLTTTRRVLSTVKDEIHELTDQINQSSHRTQEVEKISKRFESERDELQVTLEEAEAALEQEEAKVDRALADVAAAKDETERRLLEKEEEFESLRYAQLRLMLTHSKHLQW